MVLALLRQLLRERTSTEVNVEKATAATNLPSNIDSATSWLVQRLLRLRRDSVDDEYGRVLTMLALIGLLRLATRTRYACRKWACATVLPMK